MRRPRLLLVDDRPYTVDTILQEFTARGWSVQQETSLLDGVLALKNRHRTLTAAVFDRRLPRPLPDDRLHLERCGVPQSWIDSAEDDATGRVLGLFLETLTATHNVTLPYVYISALVDDDAEGKVAGQTTIDKLSTEREVTLGVEVFQAIEAKLGSKT